MNFIICDGVAHHEKLFFAIFTLAVSDLFGVDRKYMLAEMRPFIPEQDVPYFERFLRQKVIFCFRPSLHRVVCLMFGGLCFSK